MKCKNCSIEEIEYEIKFEEDTQLSFFSAIIEHLKRRKIEENIEGNRLKLNESGVKELVDFCKDHMKQEKIYYRIQDQDWKPFLEVEKVLEMQWIDEIIKNELIICYFQPIINENEEIFGYEILSRFEKDENSLIYPNVVFEAAKNRGRLYALDRICRLTAIKNVISLKSNQKAFINFIPTSIYSPEFCLKSTTELAVQLGIYPSQLVFEVVESEKVKDVDHLKKILKYYKEKGFEYALDDVGEGFNTIELLEDISPQYMKLDMKFVQGVAGNLEKQETALHFLQKALKVGSIPLAEGVESREDFEWLKHTGYKLFQGYLFGKPAPSPL